MYPVGRNEFQAFGCNPLVSNTNGNARLAATGYQPEWSLDRGIPELIKGFTILRNTIYSNV